MGIFHRTNLWGKFLTPSTSSVTFPLKYCCMPEKEQNKRRHIIGLNYSCKKMGDGTTMGEGRMAKSLLGKGKIWNEGEGRN